MLCATIKEGSECNFMTAQGCSFNGGICHTVEEKCNGCARVVDYNGGQYCNTYADPSSKWLLGKCNFATNGDKEGVKKEVKKINPLKESKRKSRGR